MIRAFVSSTSVDLKAHRAYVIGRLMAAGIFVDPMEKWTAASDEPKELSMARVKDCHLCILLVGFRLGHVPTGDKRSITQMEYVAARKLGVDVLVFMADEKADWPADALTKLKRDAGMRRWRAELGENLVRGSFTPRPESIDIDAVLSRWFQDRAAKPEKALLLAADEESFSIEIQSYSNSQAVLVTWPRFGPTAPRPLRSRLAPVGCDCERRWARFASPRRYLAASKRLRPQGNPSHVRRRELAIRALSNNQKLESSL